MTKNSIVVFSLFHIFLMSSSAETMCERCDWLCCRVYDIFDQERWVLVKRAGEKCGYLDIMNRCRIHATRHKHAGFADSCELYDCMEGGPIVTTFARRISEEFLQKYAIISSLLETIRLRVVASPESREAILDFVARELNEIIVDEKILLLSVKVVRVKIERWEGGKS